MQTWVTHFDLRESAKNLDRQRLNAQIYEGIHILASLRGMNEELVNPKRDVSNHPASKLWVGYEDILSIYIGVHLQEWYARGYSSDVNARNYDRIKIVKGARWFNLPNWVTSELIETHKNVLYRKKPDFYLEDWEGNREMRYDWREGDL
jgi:hypothetical protein